MGKPGGLLRESVLAPCSRVLALTHGESLPSRHQAPPEHRLGAPSTHHDGSAALALGTVLPQTDNP